MRQTLVVGSLLAVLALTSCAWAVGDAEKKHHPVYVHGKEEFDLRDPEQRERLIQQLSQAEIHALKLKEEQSFLSTLADQAIWTLLVFSALLFILWKYAWGPIMEGLEKREKAIAHDKLDAEIARKEAAQIREELALERAKANDQIREMMAKARENAEQLAAERDAQSKAALQLEHQRMQRELQMQADHALQQMWTQSARLATLISSKVIRKELSEADHRALIDEALNEFRAAASTRRENIENARA